MMMAGKTFINSYDVYIIGYGYGVSQYPQFYDRDSDKYQVLLHPYRGSFEGFNGENS